MSLPHTLKRREGFSMQSGKGTIIHTNIRPGSTDECNKSPVIKQRKLPQKVGFSERLLRNTAVACALLLGILTLKNIDAPWSRSAVEGIEAALTMRIDPDGSLGDMSFVRSFLPESTLVFFDISSSGLLAPVEGEVTHEFYEGQPWMMYSCKAGTSVRSALAGNVSAVNSMDSGDWCVLIDHGDGKETMYAYLEKPNVDAGDRVVRGEKIGAVRGTNMYFEYRESGISTHPFGGTGK